MRMTGREEEEEEEEKEEGPLSLLRVSHGQALQTRAASAEII